MADKKKERKSKPRKDKKTKKKQSKKKTSGLVRYSQKAPPRTRKSAGKSGSITSYGPTDYSDMVNIRNHQARQLNLRNQTLESNSREMAQYKERLNQLEKRSLDQEAEHKKKEKTWEELNTAHLKENARLNQMNNYQRMVTEKLSKAEALGVTSQDIDAVTDLLKNTVTVTEYDETMDAEDAIINSLQLAPNELEELKKKNDLLQDTEMKVANTKEEKKAKRREAKAQRREGALMKMADRESRKSIKDDREKIDPITGEKRETVGVKEQTANVKATVVTDDRSPQQSQLPPINTQLPPTNTQLPPINITIGNVTTNVDQSTKKPEQPGVVAEQSSQQSSQGARVVSEIAPPATTTNPVEPEFILLSGPTETSEDAKDKQLAIEDTKDKQLAIEDAKDKQPAILKFKVPYGPGPPSYRERRRYGFESNPYTGGPLRITRLKEQNKQLAIEDGPREDKQLAIEDGPREDATKSSDAMQSSDVNNNPQPTNVQIRKEKKKIETDIAQGKKQKTAQQLAKFEYQKVPEELKKQLEAQTTYNPAMGVEVDPTKHPTLTQEIEANARGERQIEQMEAARLQPDQSFSNLSNQFDAFVTEQIKEGQTGVRKRRPDREFTGKVRKGGEGERIRAVKEDTQPQQSFFGRMANKVANYVVGQNLQEDQSHLSRAMDDYNNVSDYDSSGGDTDDWFDE